MGMIDESLLSRRPAEIGKIKIGGKGETRKSSGGNEFQLPVKYDHFVVTGRERGRDGNFVRDAEVHRAIGAKPTVIQGVLMYETPEENFHGEMLQYAGKTKIVSCDGRERTNLKNGEVSGCLKKDGEECSCKPYMRLALQLPQDPAFGFRVFRSTSWETTANIQGTLQEIHERVGTCYQVPVELRMYPSEDSYEENGKTKTSTSYKVALVLAATMEEVIRRVVEADRTIKGAKQQLRLSAGELGTALDEDDRENEADLATEFHPPTDPALDASIATQERADALKSELGIGRPKASATPTAPADPPAPGQVDADGVVEADFEVEEPQQGPAEAEFRDCSDDFEPPVWVAASSRECRDGLEAEHRAYLQLMDSLPWPDGTDVGGAVVKFQQDVLSKPNTKHWDAEDYEKAAAHIEARAKAAAEKESEPEAAADDEPDDDTPEAERETVPPDAPPATDGEPWPEPGF